MKNWKTLITRIELLFITIFFSIFSTANAHAVSGVEAAGEVLTFFLPAVSGGLALYYKDSAGALQFCGIKCLSHRCNLYFKIFN